MGYAVSAIIMPLEALSYFFICRAFFPQRKNNRVVLVLWVAQLVCAYIFANFNIPFISAYQPFRSCIVCSFYLAFSLLCFFGPWYNHLLILVLWFCCTAVIDTWAVYGMSSFLGIPASVFIWRKWQYSLTVIIDKCAALFLAWNIFWLRDRVSAPELSKKRLLLTAIFPVASYFLLFAVYDGCRNQDDLSLSAIIFSFILIFANAAIIYLMTSLERASRAEHEVALMNQSMALQTENIKALEKSYRAQRSATHEFKHQLQVLYDLLESGDAASARNYISQLQITHSSRMFAANTRHPIVDAILNEKYQAAKENSIDVQYKVNDLSALTISTDTLVVLLSNLLDNAIEACQRLPDNRAIECTILSGETLFISIRNTSPPVKIINGTIETTKKPEREHGFGLAGVRQVVKQLDGEYAMNYSDSWFQFVAEIPA